MKKCILAIFASILTLTTWAQSSKTGLRYTVTSESESTVEIIGLSTNYIPETLTIPSTITNNDKTYKVISMNKGMFSQFTNSGKNNLRVLKIGDNVQEIPERLFFGFSNLQTIEIGKGVKTIGQSAFYSCASLTEVTFSEGLERLGTSCFGYTGLKNVKLPNSLLYVGGQAFFVCKNLESIDFGSSVKWFGTYAIQSCPALRDVTIANSSVPSGQGASTFFSENVQNASLHVPIGTKSLYQNNSAFTAFKEIIDDVLAPCPDPEIHVNKGAVSFTCPLRNVSYEYSVTYSDSFTNTSGATSSFNIQKPEAFVTIKVVATRSDRTPSKTITKSYAYNELFQSADVNGDNFVNAADVVTIYNIIIEGSGE